MLRHIEPPMGSIANGFYGQKVSPCVCLIHQGRNCFPIRAFCLWHYYWLGRGRLIVKLPYLTDTLTFVWFQYLKDYDLGIISMTFPSWDTPGVAMIMQNHNVILYPTNSPRSWDKDFKHLSCSPAPYVQKVWYNTYPSIITYNLLLLWFCVFAAAPCTWSFQ